MQDFTGKKVVVTGASSGIGYEVARLFHERGAEVVAADLDPSGVPAGTHPVAVDVSSEVDVERLGAEAEQLVGEVDILCNIAGIGATTDILDATVEEWDRVFAVNARGTFLCMRQFARQMVARRSGVIVNTASAAALVGLADRASYSASKGAVLSLTRQAAVQWSKLGVRCNTVCPGTVDSPWVGRLMNQAEDPEARRAELVARQPMGRLGEPTEIAQAVLYLASDEASFITGHDLVIDGGITAA